MLDVQLFGLNPAGHHLTNLFFHLGNTLLLFLFLSDATQQRWRSFFVAALFSLHPLHVESVAWISERKDVLSTFFWMLALVIYGRYARQRGSGRYPAVLLLFTLGLMAKPMVVTLPLVLMLMDYWPLRRTASAPDGLILRGERKTKWSGLIGEKVPFLVLSAALERGNADGRSEVGGQSGSWKAFPLAYALPILLFPMSVICSVCSGHMTSPSFIPIPVMLCNRGWLWSVLCS